MEYLLIIRPHHLAPLGSLSSFTTNQSDTKYGIKEDGMVSAQVLRSIIIAANKLLMTRQKRFPSRIHASFVIITSLNLASRQLIASFVRSTRLNMQCTTRHKSIVNIISKKSTTCVACSIPSKIPRPSLLLSLMAYLS